MVKVRIKHGLDIPLKGKVQKEVYDAPIPGLIAYDFAPFSSRIRIRPNVKKGDQVKIGTPLAHDTHHPDRLFTSEAAGRITEIVRGQKRRLLSIVIERNDKEEVEIFTPPSDNLIHTLLVSGLSPHFTKRPFGQMISLEDKPREIFISAIDSSPLAPPMSYQLKGNEECFQQGLSLLSTLAPCHLISGEKAFAHFQNVTFHQAAGPHPIGLPSTHIDQLSPIRGKDDCVWTTDVVGILALGSLLKMGTPFLERIVALTGPGFKEEGRKLYRMRAGSELTPLIEPWMHEKSDRIICGDVLHGTYSSGYLTFSARQLCALTRPKGRAIMPFIRPGFSRYTSHNTYLSALRHKEFDFSARIHGEERPIIDGALYQSVMPLNVMVEPLIEALRAKDFDAAINLGLLKVVPEDFALCEFICPSKVPFTSIVQQGIEDYFEYNLPS